VDGNKTQAEVVTSMHGTERREVHVDTEKAPSPAK